MFSTTAKRKLRKAGEAKRERDNRAKRLQSAQTRDIGPIKPVAGPERRERCRLKFRLFCEVYFPAVFYLPWSADHLKAIDKIERAVLFGGLFALAMPRGSGKTALAQIAAIWALLYGHRKFVCLIAATDGAAEAMLKNIQAAFNTNDLLLADFPEVCQPIRALEGDARRCGGQLCDGRKTNIAWKVDRIVLPTVADSIASGAIVSVCGLTGSIRGQSHTMPDGSIIRPSLVIPDDPQTRESAESDSQCANRESILKGDVLGLAGPGQKIAGVMPCTVIREGDLADRMLDRQQNPEWQGERCRMIYAFPTDASRWEEYAKIRAKSLQDDGDGHEATDYYRDNQAAMDQGAQVAWPDRFNKDEISAVQHAMNLRLRDEAAFFAEYQNDPQSNRHGTPNLKPEQIRQKVNGWGKGKLPLHVQKVTAFIDVHDAMLYWMVVGWSMDQDGYVADYGAWPDPGRRYFALHEASRTMQQLRPGIGKEGAILAGLQSLAGELFAKAWMREDETALPIDRLLVDVGYVPDTVFNFIRTSGRGGIIMGSRGVGIGAAKAPMSQYRQKPGEQLGHNWMIPVPMKRELRNVRFDSNYWKTFVYDRLALAMGDKGSLSLYGNDPMEHRLLSDHIAAEYPTPTEGHGRKLLEWRIKPGNPDNHLLDCLVGCAVAASMCGVGGTAQAQVKPWKRQRPRVTYI